MLLFSQYANAVPAYPHPVDYKQPDGSVITIRLRGDERMHWTVSSDDYTLLRNENGFYEYAIKNATGDLVLSGVRAHNENGRTAEENALLQQTLKNLKPDTRQVEGMNLLRMSASQQLLQKAVAKPKTPIIGKKRIPVILVGFDFGPFRQFSKTEAEFEAFFNQRGYSEGKATGSVHDYFWDSSYGQFDFQADIYGPYALTEEDCALGMTYAALLAAYNDGFDLSAYDDDNDGLLDCFHVVFAGYSQNIPGHNDDAAVYPSMGEVNLRGMGGHHKYVEASCSVELSGIEGSDIDGIGTTVHELCHLLLKLHDFYDVDYEKSGGESFGLGMWDVMSSGQSGDNGYTPTDISAWNKVFLDWVKAIELKDSGEITLPNPTEQKVIYRINTKTPGEYFLLENRQKQGWDTYLPDSGMLIYHVDENYLGWYDQTGINSNPFHMGLYIKQNAPYPLLGNATFTDTSFPNSKSWANESTGEPITGITQNEDGSIIFQFMDGYTSNTMDKVFWSLSGGILIVSGNGAIWENAWVNNKNIKGGVIETGITALGKNSFASCSNLTDLYVSWITPPAIQSDVFEEVEIEKIRLYIPEGTLSDYQNASVWKNFQLLEEIPLFASGICGANGDNLIWRLPFDGGLTIRGHGDMVNYKTFGTNRDSWNGHYEFKVKTVDFGSLITSIGNYTFTSCNMLTELTIPNSVTSIGDYAFGMCSGLRELIIPNSVTSIGKGAFTDCSGLKELFIPNSISSISDYAFSGCSGLTDLIIPSSVASIGMSAFAGCSMLAEFAIPNSVTLIGDYAFDGCSGLTDLIIPSSVASIGMGTFRNCSKLTDICVFWAMPPSIRNSFIFDDITVQNIKLHIPQNALSIYQNTPVWQNFILVNDMPEVETVVIDSGSCGTSGDNLSWQLSSEGVLTIRGSGEMADYFNTSLPWSSSDSYFPSLIKTVIIDNSVTSIANNAFSGCSLTDIYVSWARPPICKQYFSIDVTNIKLHIPENTLSFYQKSPVWQDFILVNDMPAVEFSEVVIASGICGATGDNLTWILTDDWALTISGSGAMKSWDYGITSAWYDYRGQIETIVIGSEVASIGAWAFFSCNKLIELTIPNSVTVIENSAFFVCSGLTEITIPSSVTSLGSGAFQECNRLTDIYVSWANPPSIANDEPFYLLNVENITLHIPQNTLSAYQNAPIWQDFILVNDMPKVLQMQSIDFPEISTQTYGNPNIVLHQYSSAGLTITYTSDNEDVATVTGNAIILHNAGNAKITAIQNGNDDYETAVPVIRSLVVEKALLTITAENKQRGQGEENPAFTLLYSGFKNNENEGVLDVLPTIFCGANINSPIGLYDIILSGGSDNNYNYILIDGKLEVLANNGNGIVETRSAYQTRTYPNPAQDDIFILSELPIEKIEIYSLAGDLLLENNFNERISVSNLLRGVYLLKVYTHEGMTISKIIKE